MPPIADAVAAYERADFPAARAAAAALLPSNHPQAHYLLGLMDSYGEGGPADPAAAAAHFRHAADAGHPGAMFSLAALYGQGRGVGQSFAEAKDWYTRAAEAGNPDGLYQLGVMHEHGQGVPADLNAAAAHWERAAAAGHPRAMVALGRLYAAGGPGRSVDPGLAAYWFFQAWQAGEDEAEHDIIGVRDALEAAADGGSASAQLALGLLVCFGHDDPAAAAPWFDLAAAQDHPEGVRMLAYLYETGKGVPADPARADRLYRRAAELGDPLAQKITPCVPASRPGKLLPFPRLAPARTPMTDPDRLRPWERAGLLAGLALVVGFGALVEVRSALGDTRRTDLGVYARAGWAALHAEDPYHPVDDRGWHYCYPPPFAVLMAPLAEPDPAGRAAAHVPFPVSVAVWYAVSVGCLGYAVHAFAGAVLPDAPRGGRRWWYARTVPAYVCLGGVGHTLGRGQVNLLVVALAAAAFAASVRGRRVASGAWLAAAAAVKVIPGLLLLDPLVRRDGRVLAGATAAAVVLLGVVPALVWGPAGAVELNRKMMDAVLAPAVSAGGDATRAAELHGAKATDSQSVRAAAQAWLYPDRESRPDSPAPLASAAHWLSGGAMLALTLVAARRSPSAPADRLVALGSLCAVMLLLTPVSHMHYYAFALPLVAGLWLRSLARRPGAVRADARTLAVLVAWGVLTAVPLFPGPVFDRLRECGLGPATTIALWAFGLLTLARTPAPTAAPVLVAATVPAGRWYDRCPPLPARSRCR